jgi:hypothetical protein
MLKAWATDVGCEVASLGVQIHGGMGFVEETGAAQHYRDARIAPIYEGTNGIQAMDLVMRKLPLENGAVVQSLLGEIQATIADLPESLSEVREALAGGLTALAAATTHLGERLVSGAYEDALAGATPYLRMMGTVLGGWLLAGGAIIATREAAVGGADRDFLLTKIATARFYATQILPQAAGLGSAVTSGAKVVMGVSTT